MHFGVLVNGWRCCYESVGVYMKIFLSWFLGSYEMKHGSDHYKDYEGDLQNFAVIVKENATNYGMFSNFYDDFLLGTLLMSC